jgi:2-hydroxychromene-2-carboxylate isomerase
MRLEFFFDYISPYAYIANARIAELRTNTEFRPIDILAVMKQVNNSPTFECPAKLRYAGIDAKRMAKHWGIRFSPNETLIQAVLEGQVEGSLFSRAALAAQEVGVFEIVNSALFDAIWIGTDDLATEEGRNVFLANRLPLVTPDLWRLSDDELIRNRLGEECTAAAERGVFGVPTIFVDNEMFFGNEGLDFGIKSLLRTLWTSAESPC